MIKSGIRLGKQVQSIRRLLHTVPKLNNDNIYEKSGIDGLYSADGFKTAWTDYQKFLTLNLTLHTNGTERELQTPFQILLQTAKQTTEQHVFHYASQAHNNHFFFEQLINKEQAQTTRPSRFLMERLADLDHPDLQSFKEEFLLVAESHFGQGWVFLVELPDKSLRIIRCNNEGTPYYFGKNQSLDFNGGVDEKSFEHLNSLKERAARGERDFTLPLLAMNCWDVAFIKDYGVNGRSEYLSNVWDCINWDVVNKRLFQV